MSPINTDGIRAYMKYCPDCRRELPKEFMFAEDGEMYTCKCGTQMFWSPITGLYFPSLRYKGRED